MFSVKRMLLVFFVVSAFAGNVFGQSWVNDLLVHRTPSFTEDGADSCLMCHSGEKMRAVSEGVHGDTDNPLTPFAQNQCETCHGAGSIHISRAHGGKGYPPLTIFGYERGAATRDQQVEVCLSCHTDESSGIKVTPFHGTLHDKWIVNCSSCHQAHVESDPVLDRKLQAEVCLACHMNQKTEHRKVGRGIPDFNRMGCAGCHRVHRLPKAKEGAE